MDVQFDDELKKVGSAKTRIYSPTKTGTLTPVLEDTSMPIRPQPTKEARKKRSVRTEVRLTTMSKILILLSVFAIAATALFALFGAADYARIVSDTSAVNKEIESYNQQISQLRKTQSANNDFQSINKACSSRGMTMNWYQESPATAEPTANPSEPTARQTFTPDGVEP